MTQDQNAQHRPKVPGIKTNRLKVPGIVDDVTDWICVQMNIPDDDDYIRQFYDLFDDYLGWWFNYHRDTVQGGARTAKIWRLARQTIQLDNCTGSVTVDACNPTPIGSILIWPKRDTIPASWLPCEGQALSATTYADLFAAIGYTYGGSEGTFLLPDMRGRSPIHTGQVGSGQTYVEANEYGSEQRTLLAANLPPHQHNILAKDNTGLAANARVAAAGGTGSDSTKITQDGSANGLTSTPFDIVHPVLAMTFVIRVANDDCEYPTIQGEQGPPGAIGPQGPPGTNGICEECGTPPPGEDGGEIDPPPGEPGDNKRCAVAQGVVDSLIDNYYKPLLEFYIQQFDVIENSPEEVIDALIKTLQGASPAIIWPPIIIQLIGTLGSALLAAYISSVGAAAAIGYLQDIIDGLDDTDNRELWYCDLYNAVGTDGDIDAAVWNEFVERVGSRSGIPHADLYTYLLNNIPLYIARVEAYVSEGGAFDCTTCAGELCDEEYRQWVSVAVEPLAGWSGVNGSLDTSSWEGDTTEIGDVTYSASRVANGSWRMQVPANVTAGFGVRRVFDPPCLVDRLFSTGTKNHTNRVRRICVVKRADDGIWQVAMNTNNTGVVNTVYNSGGNFDPPLLISEAMWLYISERSAGDLIMTLGTSQVNTD